MAFKIAISLFLTVLMVGSLALGCFSVAQAQSSISKPSIPTFTLSFIDHSYDLPGRIVQDGYIGPHFVPVHHDRNGTVEITIVNQPFKQYVDANDHTVVLYFHVRCKGHLDSNWITYPDPGYVEASDSQYSVFSYYFNEEYVGDHAGRVPNIAADGKLDFQVETFIGYTTTICTSIAQRVDDYVTYYTGETSGWSQTQTISLNDGSTSTPDAIDQTEQPTPPPTPQASSIGEMTPSMQIQTASPNPIGSFSVKIPFNWIKVGAIVVVGLMFAVLIIVIAFMHRRITILELKQNSA